MGLRSGRRASRQRRRHRSSNGSTARLQVGMQVREGLRLHGHEQLLRRGDDDHAIVLVFRLRSVRGRVVRRERLVGGRRQVKVFDVLNCVSVQVGVDAIDKGIGRRLGNVANEGKRMVEPVQFCTKMCWKKSLLVRHCSSLTETIVVSTKLR